MRLIWIKEILSNQALPQVHQMLKKKASSHFHLTGLLFRHNAKVKKITREVQALRQEASVKREPTSVTIKDLFEYIRQNEGDDPLLKRRKWTDSCCIV